MPMTQQPPLIYDFGMHIADDTEVYLKKGFRVVAIEADPLLCDAACDRFADEISKGDLVVLNKAIGNREGAFDFYVCNEQTTLSTASPNVVKAQMRAKGVTFRTVKVAFTTADKILSEFGKARFAKIDIEGHDLMCLQQIASGCVLSDYLSFEVDLHTYRQGLAVCQDMGFTRFMLVPQISVNGARAPSPSKEGKSIDHKFGIGQSGPFGDDLQGEWRNADAVARQCLRLRVQSKAHGALRRLGAGGLASRLLPGTQTWYDIHARR
jgi:FkbM family methyltransferase